MKLSMYSNGKFYVTKAVGNHLELYRFKYASWVFYGAQTARLRFHNEKESHSLQLRSSSSNRGGFYFIDRDTRQFLLSKMELDTQDNVRYSAEISERENSHVSLLIFLTEGKYSLSEKTTRSFKTSKDNNLLDYECAKEQATDNEARSSIRALSVALKRNGVFNGEEVRSILELLS